MNRLTLLLAWLRRIYRRTRGGFILTLGQWRVHVTWGQSKPTAPAEKPLP